MGDAGKPMSNQGRSRPILAITPEAFGGFGVIPVARQQFGYVSGRSGSVEGGHPPGSYEKFRERPQDIIGGLRVETVSAE
jgi:hypothetical protein